MLASSRRSLLLPLVLVAAFVSSCKKDPTSILLVTVSGDVPGVNQLKATVTSGGATKIFQVPDPARALTLPVTFTIQFAGAATGTVAVDALDVAGAVVASGQSDFSLGSRKQGAVAVALEVPATPPAVPADLAASASDGQVTLTWSPVADATSYNLYFATAAGVSKTTGTKIASVTSPYLHTGLTNGTTYYYVVTAVGPGGESAESKVASATPKPIALAAPTDVAATPGNAQVTLSWTAVAGATSYNVYFATVATVDKATGSKLASVTSPYVHTGLTNGTKVYYVVTALNAVTESPESAVVSATPTIPAPSAPAGVAAAPGDKQVTITWSPVTGATGYNLYWSTTAGVTAASGNRIASVGSPYVHTALTNGTKYYYVVTALNAGGESAESTEVNATPQVPAPSAPTGVSASPGDGQVTITWSAVTGATSYNVYFSTSAGVSKVSGAPLAGVASPYKHTGRLNGTRYYYVVTAVNAGGESGESAQVNATPGVTTAGAPTGVAAVGNDTEVTVSWSPVGGATAYNLYFLTTGPPTIATGTKIATVTSPHMHTGLTNGTTYYYVVTAMTGASESAESLSVNATPQVALPPAPTGVSASPGDGQVTINWNAVIGATGYDLYFGTAAGISKASSKVADVTRPYVHTGRTNGTKYYYVVVAKNAAGESGISTEVNATPQILPPSPPTAPTATRGDTQVTLTWSPVTGATSYNLYYATTTGVTSASGTKVAGVTSPYTKTGLTNGTTYYFVLTAANVAGESAESTEVSATPQIPAPGAPTGVSLTAGDTQVMVSWSAVATAASYTVYYSTMSDLSSPSTKTGVTGTSTTVTGLANGTQYYFAVTAVNAGGESGQSIPILSATPNPPAPGAPTGVGAAAGDAQVTVSWTVVAGATSYKIYYATSSPVMTGTAMSQVVAGGGSTMGVVTGLANETLYYFAVTATSAGGESGLSSEASATPVALPGMPGTLSLVRGGNKLTLNWSAPSSGGTPASYKIYRGTAPGVSTSGAPFATVPAPGITYDDNTAVQGTTYYYRIVASNAAGSGAPSNEAFAKPLDPPGVVTGLGVTRAVGKLTLNWTAPAAGDAPTSYNVYRGTTSSVSTSGAAFATFPAPAATWDDTAVSPGTTYYYKIVAVNAAGAGADSSEVSDTPIGPPHAPTGLGATPGAMSSGTISLAWTAPAAGDPPTGYKIYRSTTSPVSTSGAPLDTVGMSTLTYDDMMSLVSSTTYYYKVVATNAAGDGPASNEASAVAPL